MKRISSAALCLLLAWPCAQAVEANDSAVIAMAERGAALIKAKGKRELMEQIHAHDPRFVDPAVALTMRDLYTAIVIAHPANEALVGGIDADGQAGGAGAHPRHVIELAQRDGKGWLSADAAPVRGARTRSYVLRVGDVVLEAAVHAQ